MSTNNNALLAAALSYVAQGFKVFPLKAGGKKPITPHGLKDASQIQATITEYWSKYPDANIGLVCDGLLVLDFDGKAGVESKTQLIAKYGELPRTWVIKTGGGTQAEPKEQGEHYVYRVPTDLNIRPGAGKYGYQNLDIRANDSYIVAVPSITRLPYETIDGSPIAQAPRWLIDLARDKGRRPASGGAQDSPIPDKTRNDTLTSMAGAMRRKGANQGAIEAALREINASQCQPPLSDDEVMKIAQSVSRYHPKPDAPPRPNEANRLVKLVEDREVILFHDDVTTPFARVPIEERFETWPCRSTQFRRWLAGQFWQTEAKAPSAESISAALNVIEAKGCFEGEEHILQNRVARHNGGIYYDLADRRWRAVMITPEGWEIVNQPPILFRRYAHQAAQVEPARGGDPRRLLDFANIKDEAQKALFMVYVASCFIPDIPHPVPQLHGGKGSAKTSLFRFVRLIVDPSTTPVLSLPRRNNNELVQTLSHHWLSCFDNVSYLSDEFSDTFCRAVTGEGFSKRELYSDDDDIIYRFRRCVGLNGINISAIKPDLLDRAILFHLESISKEKRREERVLLEEFEKARPGILGGFLDAVSRAMNIYPNVRLHDLPRMADFARWGCAIAQALGYSQDTFLSSYDENIARQNEEALASNAVATVLMAFMESKNDWTGSPSELYQNILGKAEEMKVNTKAKKWPGAPYILTRRLNELQANFDAAGITIKELPKTGKEGRRLVVVRTPAPSLEVPNNAVTGVTAVTIDTNSGPSSDASDATDGDKGKVASLSEEPASHTCGDASDASDAIFPDLTGNGGREEILTMWARRGRPLIHLGPGENCEDLEALLGNPATPERHLAVVRAWFEAESTRDKP